MNDNPLEAFSDPISEHESADEFLNRIATEVLGPSYELSEEAKAMYALRHAAFTAAMDGAITYLCARNEEQRRTIVRLEARVRDLDRRLTEKVLAERAAASAARSSDNNEPGPGD